MGASTFCELNLAIEWRLPSFVLIEVTSYERFRWVLFLFWLFESVCNTKNKTNKQFWPLKKTNKEKNIIFSFLVFWLVRNPIQYRPIVNKIINSFNPFIGRSVINCNINKVRKTHWLPMSFFIKCNSFIWQNLFY
jgi:hypothetical protein